MYHEGDKKKRGSHSSRPLALAFILGLSALAAVVSFHYDGGKQQSKLPVATDLELEEDVPTQRFLQPNAGVADSELTMAPDTTNATDTNVTEVVAGASV